MYHKKRKGKIVLVGGCFDILHPGHVIFLQEAKRAGDYLIVLLESDEKIKKIKGVNRPIHTQKERELVLEALKFVDEVVSLPYLETEIGYDDIVAQIKPNIIAITSSDPNIHHKKRSAKLVNAELKTVVKRLESYSTSKLLDH